MYVKALKYSLVGGVLGGIVTAGTLTPFLCKNLPPSPVRTAYLIFSIISATLGDGHLSSTLIDWCIKNIEEIKSSRIHILVHAFLSFALSVGIPTYISIMALHPYERTTSVIIASSYTILTGVIGAVVISLFNGIDGRQSQAELTKKVECYTQ